MNQPPTHYANKFVERLAELDQAGEPFVAVTLVEAVGSTPQDIGAKMLVTAQGLNFGTVGGGRVEQKAIVRAQELIADTSRRSVVELVNWNLQRDVGMTCGGSVRLFLELFNVKRWHIVIFGAGHVAQSLVRYLLPLDCHVTCIDSRRDWLERLPTASNLTIVCAEDPTQEVERLNPRDFVLCMTMGHRTDRPILARIFRGRHPFDYLGVIGSRAKRKVLERELREEGLDAATVGQFVCPIGLPLGTNHPAEISISIVAQLIQVRDRLRQPTIADNASS